MNKSYDPLRLINTYGAFGTVNEVRDELIISSAIDWDTDEWKEYEFYSKPGNIYSKPKFISPYHHRIDWQMWVAATTIAKGSSLDTNTNRWLKQFLIKLLQQESDVINLIKVDPWKDSKINPKYIRTDRYRYEFHTPSKTVVTTNTTAAANVTKNEKSIIDNKLPYWDRTLIGRVYPRQGIATIESIQAELL